LASVDGLRMPYRHHLTTQPPEVWGQLPQRTLFKKLLYTNGVRLAVGAVGCELVSAGLGSPLVREKYREFDDCDEA